MLDSNKDNLKLEAMKRIISVGLTLMVVMKDDKKIINAYTI